MSDTYDVVNPNIPSRPSEIVKAVKKIRPGLNHKEFFIEPRPVSSGKNVRIEYPGFLRWLKFYDGERRSGKLNQKVTKYQNEKLRYEQQMADQLKEFRAGKVSIAAQIVMAQIDQAQHVVKIAPLRWNENQDDSGFIADSQEDALASGHVYTDKHRRRFVGTGSGSDGVVIIDMDNARSGTSGRLPGEALLHELVHAMFALDGKLTKIEVNRGYENSAEFDAILVANIYRSEGGKKTMRGNHGNADYFSDTDDFLHRTDIRPRPLELINRFATYEPEVARKLAGIPKARAVFNPMPQFYKELKAAAQAFEELVTGPILNP